MARKIVVIPSDKAAPLMLTEIAAFDEAQLQRAMMENPDLLPIDEFGMTGPLLVIGRETLLPSGKVDLVLLARTGELVLVEFKTGPTNPDFRAVLAQLVDYGSDLWRMSSDQFEQAVPVRFFSSQNCTDAKFKGLKSLNQALIVRWPDMSEQEAATLQDAISQQLKTGAFHYIAVAQNFTPVVLRTIEYMNSSMPRSRFYAVEMVRFASDSFAAFESRTILKSQPAGAGAPGGDGVSARTIIDVQKFLDAVGDPEYKQALAEFIQFLESFGLALAWGTVGTSVRVQPADGGSLLSIGWLNPPGQSGWMGLTNLNFGFDPGSAAAHPTTATALEKYANALAAVPGAQATSKGNLRAYHFTPEVALKSFPQVKEIISQVVADVSGGNTD